MPNRRRISTVARVLTWIVTLAALSVGTTARAAPIILDYTVVFDNSVQTVGPTDVIPIFVTIFNKLLSTEPIGDIDARSFVSGDLFSGTNPYLFTFGPPDITDIAIGATATALFGTLSPKGGVAPFGTFTSEGDHAERIGQ